MKKNILQSLGRAIIFAVVSFILTWFAFVFQLSLPSNVALLCLTALGFAAAFFISLIKPRIGKILCIIGGTVVAVCIVINFAIIFAYLPQVDYAEVDDGKEALYADRRVMVIVPHQDDEINLAGGVMEEYIRYGSEVYVVFSTNGDYSVSANQRLHEGIDALSVLGVDEEHIIFLGYGDNCWDNDEKVPLYNADGLTTSHAGFTLTYALEDHPPFRAGREYTRQNLIEDMQDVILQYRPDVIHAVDCDKHVDHVLTALSFDRAMGELLKNNVDYTPTVYKGYAYSTAYHAYIDFLSLNILQTKNPESEANLLAPGIHDWVERVRMPVSAASLSRVVETSRLYDSAKQHRSQDESDRIERLMNGDKVFWQRETTSLCYRADVQASSGNAALLNNFVLADTSNADKLDESLCGVWHPDSNDGEPCITITFDEPHNIRRIKLYDDPSPSENILAAVLIINGETEIETGALKPLGSATEIAVNADSVDSITLKITEFDGVTPGLTEIEVFEDERDTGASFIKLMNGNGDFAYDYYIDPCGEESFDLYTYGCATELGDCEVLCDGGVGCDAYINNGKLFVRCPVGENCIVTVSDGTHADTVMFRNSGSDDAPYAMALCSIERGHIRPTIRNVNHVVKTYVKPLFDNVSWWITYNVYSTEKFIEYYWHKVF